MTTLKAALQEAYFMELEEIPSEEILSEDEALTFSPVLLSGCTVLAVSPEARAAFVGWVRELSEGWFVYRYTGKDQTAPKNIVYCPTWVPDGYKLITEPKDRAHIIAIYENPEEDIILFNCYMNTESMNLQIGEDTQLIDAYVSNIPADLYIDNTSGAVNHLVWEDENKQRIFWITSTLDGETMIKIAESVETQEAPKELAEYRPTWIPEGYNELKKSISDNHVSIIYENDEGYLLSFTYTRNRESVSVYSEYQGTDVQTVIVGDNAADLYLDQREGNTNTLIWSDEEKSAIFVISAHCSSDELIKIAESVEAVQ